MAAPYNPPKRAEDFKIRVAVEDYDAPGNFQINPTLATGDWKVDKDGAGFNNLATLPSVSPTGGRCILITLSGGASGEMDAEVVTIQGVDQTSPKEWADFILCIPTTT